MMKKQFIEKIKKTREEVLFENFYFKPEDTPWQSADETEPICGLGEYVDEHMELYKSDEREFFKNMIAYFYHTTSAHGQMRLSIKPFLPFTKGSDNYDEWNDLDKEQILKQVDSKTLEFLLIGENYGYPDTFFICLDDSNPENPMVYSTDITEYFDCITQEGMLDEFLEKCISPRELEVMVRSKVIGVFRT